MRIEVARATAAGADSVALDVPERATVAEALAASPFADAAFAALAIHGEVVTPTRPLRDGDRVELLSSLLEDPKTARRNRALSSRPHPPGPRPRPRRRSV
ncbi:MAG: RnfH family protein [Gammaproteobacteria bacterium]|nr:RnfH family protein [Gammaproteobacteria bacterium]